MKLLFLDIDGVLNSKRSDIVKGDEKTVSNFDPISLGLLQNVVNETNAIICLTSDWRFTHYVLDLGRQLNLPIIYQIQSREDEDRKKEVEHFLSTMKEVKTYAILDDTDYGFDKNFVKVDGDNGISYDNYLDLLDILQGGRDD